ncbi:hypothetical protein [Xanthocytophaga agilis]|uniref:Uncharacterized protein n=1 Tax=Xanthocytophaga agilis TaxID=3048010 RepID=A0AAE3R7L7_9BACT|nr:hypothetical protein [Xanthocytophaga agilis]MDJ1505146.1 hypothetical protein [Xanthocytophaga agilis]
MSCKGSTEHYDWKVSKYKYVKAYVIPDHLACLCFVDEMRKKEFIARLDSTQNKLLPDKILSEKQIREIETLFTKTSEDDMYGMGADCFNPRHAIVYYDDQHRPTNALLVCFECGRIEAFPNTQENLNFYTDNFRSFFEKLGLPVFDNPIEYEAYIDSLKTLKKTKK